MFQLLQHISQAAGQMVCSVFPSGLTGGLLLLYIYIRAVTFYSKFEYSYSNVMTCWKSKCLVYKRNRPFEAVCQFDRQLSHCTTTTNL